MDLNINELMREFFSPFFLFKKRLSGDTPAALVSDSLLICASGHLNSGSTRLFLVSFNFNTR